MYDCGETHLSLNEKFETAGGSLMLNTENTLCKEMKD